MYITYITKFKKNNFILFHIFIIILQIFFLKNLLYRLIVSPPVLLGIWTRTKDWRLDNKLIEDLRDEVAAEKLGVGGGGYRAFLRL